ncbi:unnamed protein product [Linum trigynum]|uniref:F-box domain-containing protein n=1 Tax=Linum trigynum TaxID=586398 RepID=A0AAV2E1Q5_9ROSI
MERSDSVLDRISQLPDDIIHRILHCLDTDVAAVATRAATTSILSKRWLHLWRSYPVLQFREAAFGRDDACPGGTEGRFRRFAAASLERITRLQEPPSSTSSSLLKLNSVRMYLESQSWAWRGGDWAGILEEHCNCKSLSLSPVEVDVSDSFCPRYISPSTLSWNLSRTQVLKLSRFNLDSFKYINEGGRMERLKVVHLYRVRIGSSTKASALVSSLCRNAETVSLTSVEGLKSLHVSSNTLKSLSIQGFIEGGGGGGDDYSDLEVHIASAPLLRALDVSLLDSLTLDDSSSSSSTAPDLQDLTLRCCNSHILTQSRLDHLLSNFPSLHSLSLLGSARPAGARTLRVSSSSLGVLPFKCFPLADLHSIDHGWFRGLRDFLARLTRAHPHLHLELELKNCIYKPQPKPQQQVPSFQSERGASSGHVKECPLIVQHLELGAFAQTELDATEGGDALLGGFFSICRPNFLSISRACREPIFFFLYSCFYDQLLKRHHRILCCWDFTCWRHQLCSVKIRSDVHDQMIEISLSRDIVSSIVQQRNKVRFTLIWH